MTTADRGTVTRLMLAVVATLVLAACPGPILTSSGCPQGSRAAVLWSSETSPHSQVQLVGEQGVLATRPVRVMGIRPSMGVRVGDTTYFHATGTAAGERTSLVAFDHATCGVRVTALPHAGSFTLSVGGEGVFVTVSPVSRSEVYRYDLDGTERAATTLPGVLVTALAPDSGRLYALAIADDHSRVELVVMDAGHLGILQRVPLPGVGTGPASVVVHGGVVYFPLALVSELEGGEDRRLGIVDLATMTFRTTDLREGVPYLAAVHGEGLIVAHTFLNPTLRPMPDYRYLSIVSWTGQPVGGGDLGLGILSFATTEDAVVVLGLDSAEQPHVASYAIPSLERRWDVPLGASEQWGGYHYPAGVVAIGA